MIWFFWFFWFLLSILPIWGNILWDMEGNLLLQLSTLRRKGGLHCTQSMHLAPNKLVTLVIYIQRNEIWHVLTHTSSFVHMSPGKKHVPTDCRFLLQSSSNLSMHRRCPTMPSPTCGPMPRWRRCYATSTGIPIWNFQRSGSVFSPVRSNRVWPIHFTIAGFAVGPGKYTFTGFEFTFMGVFGKNPDYGHCDQNDVKCHKYPY